MAGGLHSPDDDPGPHWQEKDALLVTNLNEHKETKKLSGTYSRYQVISSPILLLAGEKSPEFAHTTNQVLANTLPLAKCGTLPGLSHLSPENKEAPDTIAGEIIRFLA